MANKERKALIMSEDEWQKNKQWLLKFPGAFCNPVIEQLERYLRPLPAVPSDPSALISEENETALNPEPASNQEDQS